MVAGKQDAAELEAFDAAWLIGVGSEIRCPRAA